VASLFKLGINKIAQKVGEEAVEGWLRLKRWLTMTCFKSSWFAFHYLFCFKQRIQDQRCS
jgi:phosphoribosyl-ATP pyrophosphohydrolase